METWREEFYATDYGRLYLMHYRTKGSRNGISTTEGYKAIGDVAGKNTKAKNNRSGSHISNVNAHGPAVNSAINRRDGGSGKVSGNAPHYTSESNSRLYKNFTGKVAGKDTHYSEGDSKDYKNLTDADLSKNKNASKKEAFDKEMAENEHERRVESAINTLLAPPKKIIEDVSNLATSISDTYNKHKEKEEYDKAYNSKKNFYTNQIATLDKEIEKLEKKLENARISQRGAYKDAINQAQKDKRYLTMQLEILELTYKQGQKITQ